MTEGAICHMLSWLQISSQMGAISTSLDAIKTSNVALQMCVGCVFRVADGDPADGKSAGSAK